jgi:hypothetical protein
LHDGGDDFANDRRDDLTDDCGHNEPDKMGGEDDDWGAEENQGERGGAKKNDLHETTLLNDGSTKSGSELFPKF